MEFRILGPLEVVTDEGAISLGGPEQRAVLAHLSLRANHPVHADRLIDGLVIDWSPDGRWIAASTPHNVTTSSGTSNYRVYLIRADGSETFWIGSGAEPSWRPGTG